MATFSNGSAARELLVDSDDAAYRSRFVWTADFQPHELRDYVDSQMELGIGIIKKTLDSQD